MAKRMLIDSTHAEETRVVVLDGTRLEDFDIETAAKRQLKGNIYLAKVVRVEPSLQAAFVEYGGNRHGFLAFSEIHPDYYQIPVADRQRLLAMQAEEARLEEEEEDLELALTQAAAASPPPARREPPPAPVLAEHWAYAGLPPLLAPGAEPAPDPAVTDIAPMTASAAEDASFAADAVMGDAPAMMDGSGMDGSGRGVSGLGGSGLGGSGLGGSGLGGSGRDEDDGQPDAAPDAAIDALFGSIPEEAPPETVGGDAGEADERPTRRFPPRFLRNYQIQEVIHRRQILLVQVVKEERGTKGAALTTYLSLAGRFSVLMPNSPSGGGISRKITSASDRRRLKEIMAEVDLPRGMGLIVRTAGAQRPKPEIKRDCEYLLRLWDDIREHTLKSIAPAMIYEEASLIKRAIRDVYSRDIEDITVDGDAGWHAAHDFMRMLMPTHARKVIHWPDQGQSLFARYQVEAQLDAMLQPIVQLRSGGYLVINQAEALVAIDVNSGRSTRERNVEETAVRTNLEAADEVARQLRLRDLAGLIVIDFIDMESKRHNAMVERRLKEALKNDRARIQVGHISHFGLLEMSRQRLRPSLEETTLITCAHCSGTGHVRGTESSALHVLRGVEEEAGKRRSAEVIVHVATAIALYILNHKRERLNEIERRYGMRAIIATDDTMIAPRFRVERLRAIVPGEEPRFVTPDAPRGDGARGDGARGDGARGDVTRGDVTRGDVTRGETFRPTLVSPPLETGEIEEDDILDTEDAEDTADAATVAAAGLDSAEGREAAERQRRGRRRRRNGRRDDEVRPNGADAARDDRSNGADAGAARDDRTDQASAEAASLAITAAPGPAETAAPAARDEANRRERDRGRGRGRDRNRRGRREEEGEFSPAGAPGAEQPDLPPVYSGPTPADPYGSGHVFDIFDAMEQAELNATAPRQSNNRRNEAPRRPRWQPPAWASAAHPPMLAAEPIAARPEGPEPWALPSRPFMLRRDRHMPRWARQQQGATPRQPDPVPVAAAPIAEAPEPVAPIAGASESWAMAGAPPLLTSQPAALTDETMAVGAVQTPPVQDQAVQAPSVQDQAVQDQAVQDQTGQTAAAPQRSSARAPRQRAAQGEPRTPASERTRGGRGQQNGSTTPARVRVQEEKAEPWAAAGEPRLLARETGRGRKAVPIEAGPPPVLPVHTEAPAHEASPDSTGTGGAPAVAPPVPVVTEAAAHTPPPPAMPPRTMPPAPSPVTEETVPPPAMPGTVTGTGDAPADPVHTALPVAANDAAPSPLIQPIMVGEAPPPERKRGWWKR